MYNRSLGACWSVCVLGRCSSCTSQGYFYTIVALSTKRTASYCTLTLHFRDCSAHARNTQKLQVCSEELAVQNAVAAALQPLSITPTVLHSNYLYEPADLPFDYPHAAPKIFTQFRKAVESRGTVKPSLEVPVQLRPLPTVEVVETGPLPTVASLTDNVLTEPEPDSRAVHPFPGEKLLFSTVNNGF
jgi:deoxyribodipyrimidine photolyase